MAAPSTSQNAVQTPAGQADNSSEPVRGSSPNSSRKKRKNEENHHRVKKKRLLHSAQGKLGSKDCTHRADRSFCQAPSLTPNDIDFNFRNLYNCQTKVEQDAFILNLMEIGTAKRPRVAQDNRRKKKSITTSYNLLEKETRNKVQVCKQTFISVLSKFGLVCHG